MSKIKGCTNHGCLVAPLPKGAIGTNAICQCMRDPMTAQRVAQDRLRLMAERDRLQAFVKRVAVLDAAAWIDVAAMASEARATLKGEQ